MKTSLRLLAVILLTFAFPIGIVDADEKPIPAHDLDLNDMVGKDYHVILSASRQMKDSSGTYLMVVLVRDSKPLLGMAIVEQNKKMTMEKLMSVHHVEISRAEKPTDLLIKYVDKDGKTILESTFHPLREEKQRDLARDAVFRI